MHERRCYLEQLYHSFQEPLQIINHFSLQAFGELFFVVAYFPCSFRNIKKTDAKSDAGRSSEKAPKSNKEKKSKKPKEEEADQEEPAPPAPPSKKKRKEAEPVEPEEPKKKRKGK